MTALLYDKEVETRTPAEQASADRPAYRSQLDYLFRASPFYRRKLQDAGFADAKSAGDLPEIAQLPFTEKDEIRKSQADTPPFGSHLAAPRSDIARIYSTSGTTGDPVYMPVTRNDLAMWLEISARTYTATGLRAGMTVASTYNAGPFVAGAVFDTFTKLGVCSLPIGTGGTARLARAMQLIGLQALLCTPSYALHLAEYLAGQNITADKLGLQHLCVAGEPGGGDPQIRHRLERSFGARVCEAMGIGDISISLWGECDAQDGMHFCGGDFVHVELIDPESGTPLALVDGAQGELVYTALRREAAPMLRFRSRDHVRIGVGQCRCGRNTLRVRCLGRTDDLLIVRGVNVFPAAVRAVVGEFAPAISGQIMVRPLRRGVRQEPPLPVTVELAPGETGGATLAEAIEQAVRARLLVGVRISLVAFGSLPRSEYKAKLIDFSTAATAKP
jgi:phenylacetate-CoA ligase